MRIRFVKKDDSKLKAVASITIDDCFVVHDIKVIEGEKGLFIAMPSRNAAASFRFGTTIVARLAADLAHTSANSNFAVFVSESWL